jgi:ubiquitin-like 1-activating enzyme E1 A
MAESTATSEAQPEPAPAQTSTSSELAAQTSEPPTNDRTTAETIAAVAPLEQFAAPVPDLNGTSELPFDASTYDLNGYSMNDPNFMMPSMAFMPNEMAMAQPISADEIALYDRQIRLWGVQAQEKIRSANILLIGMKGLGTEIAKNLVLAGVGTLTILDGDLVTDDDLGAQFFISREQVGQNRAQAAQPEIQKLNPRVNLFVDSDIIFTKLPEYFSSFDITIATGLPVDALASINTSCRNFNRKFYAAETHGLYGYIFADLVIHQFIQERLQPNVPTQVGKRETTSRSIIGVSEKTENGKKMEVVTKQEEYSPFLLTNLSPLPAESTKTVSKRRKVTPLLTCLRALFDFQSQNGGRFPALNRQQDLALFTKLAQDKHLELQLPMETMTSEVLRSFLMNLGAELSPVVAYLGGRLAQDVINVLGQREQPLQNFLLFDGENFASPVYSLQPVFDDSMAVGMGMSIDMTGTNGGMADMQAPNMNGTATAA